jgi:hypothetical protein
MSFKMQHEVHHSPRPRALVQKMWSFTSLPPTHLHNSVLKHSGTTVLTFTLSTEVLHE